MNPLSSVGTGELILILVIALIFLGPERLPEIARSVGKTIRQFRDALQGMSSQFGEELASVQEVTRDLQQGIQAVQEVRNLPQTLVSTVAAPLVEAVEPVKAAVEGAKEAVEATPSLLSVQVEESASDETTASPESESVTEAESKEDDSRSSDEPQVVIENDRV